MRRMPCASSATLPHIVIPRRSKRPKLAIAKLWPWPRNWGMRPLVAHCHRGLGILYAKVGRREQAHAELSAAIALYHAMDMTFWLPQAEAAQAQVVKEDEGHL
jgi:hypothetical protein